MFNRKSLLKIAKPLAFLSVLSSLLITPGMAMAGSKGRLNTTIGLGAATIHQALKGKKTNALILGAGTAYAYSRYNKARKDEKRRQRAAEYRRTRYTRTYRTYSTYGAASPRRASGVRRHYHTVNGRRQYHTHAGRIGHRH